MTPFRAVALALVVSLGVACAADQPAPPPIERAAAGWMIAGALLVDGSGAPPRVADVRVVDDRIDAVGELEALPGEPVIDGAGLALAPGFIDTHSHADEQLLDEPTALAAVSQGITTVVVGQDGSSVQPLRQLFRDLEKRGTAVNVASFSGHNTLRELALGDDAKRHATEGELYAMLELLQRDLDAGALGLSTGLEYEPGILSSTDEVVTLARVAAHHGGRYASHLRSEDRRFWEAVDEILTIGREAGLPVHVSHLKLAMTSLHGETERLLSILDRARAEGIEVTADLYPYTYWQSGMTVLFPGIDFEDLKAARFALTEVTTPEGVLVSRFDAAPSLVGRTLAEIAAERGADPEATLIDLIRRSKAFEEETGEGDSESIIATSMTEADVEALASWPHLSFCTDGDLDDPHPRGIGAFPRVLGRYVRERGVLTLEEAVRRMTSLAAASMGLAERGTVAPGMFADLVLFDPESILDRATTDDPHAVSVGVERVWVAGEEVYAAGEVTGELPGRVLRRR